MERDILNNISKFKNEIGNNIVFYESQYKLNVNGLIYKVDIVLYDKANRYFILIDLKINKVSQKDISQMQFYVDYFNTNEKDNNPVGLILCETKDFRVMNNENIYQIRYLNEIPKEEKLLSIINENKVILLQSEKF